MAKKARSVFYYVFCYALAGMLIGAISFLLLALYNNLILVPRGVAAEGTYINIYFIIFTIMGGSIFAIFGAIIGAFIGK